VDERMTKKNPVAFIAEHGVVLQSARHARIPSFVEFVAGEKIRGSWWGHEKGREIFHALGVVYDSPDVVALKLVDDKLTLVHRRLWPALAALADAGRLDPKRLTKVTQEHTAAGRHEKHEERFPEWLPRGLKRPSVERAIAELGDALAASLLR